MHKNYSKLLAATVATAAIISPIAVATATSNYADGFYIKVKDSEVGKFYTMDEFNNLSDLDKINLIVSGLENFSVYIEGLGVATLQESLDNNGDILAAFTNNGSFGTTNPGDFINGSYQGIDGSIIGSAEPSVGVFRVVNIE